MNILAFLRSLFSGKPVTQAKPQPTEVTTEEQNHQEEDEQDYWWNNPYQHAETFEFEALTNTVLFDELFHSLKTARLQIIEIPENLTRILAMVNQKNFNYKELKELISKSPVLTGDFLSLANSVAFSRGIKVGELGDALPRLGKQTIQSILYLNASKMSIPEQEVFAKTAEEVVLESQVVAKIARHLAPIANCDANEAFLAGLLHNIGKLGLLKQLSQHYDLPPDLDIDHHQALFKNILPIFYQQAGKAIGQYWKLEEKIITCISSHNKLPDLVRMEVDEADLKLAALINFSLYLARILGYGEALKEVDIFALESASILNLEQNNKSYSLLKKIPEVLEA